MARKPKYKVGNQVVLVSDGPTMAVTQVHSGPLQALLDGDEIWYGCTWFAGKKNEHGRFPEEVLRLAKDEN